MCYEDLFMLVCGVIKEMRKLTFITLIFLKRTMLQFFPYCYNFSKYITV